MDLNHVCCQHVLNMYLLFELSDQLVMMDQSQPLLWVSAIPCDVLGMYVSLEPSKTISGMHLCGTKQCQEQSPVLCGKQ